MTSDTHGSKTHSAAVESRQEIATSTLELRLRIDDDFVYEPGQYIWLRIPLETASGKVSEHRAFSIVSQQDAHNIAIIFRRGQSPYKRALELVDTGTPIEIIGPFGFAFQFPQENPDSLVLIAGGTGVTPFITLMRDAPSKRPNLPITLVYQDSDSAQMVCRDEIDGGARHNPRFKSKLLTRHLISDDLQDIDTTPHSLYYVSGPQGFVDSVSTVLAGRGVDRARIRYEALYPRSEGDHHLAALVGREVIYTDTILTPDEWRDRSRLFVSAIMSSTNHIVITDSNGAILFANTAAERMTGYTFDEMRGNTPRLWGGLMSRGFYEKLWASKAHGDPVNEELVNRRKDGSLYTVLSHISPIKRDDGTIWGYIATEEDISEIKRRQNEIVETSRALDNFFDSSQDLMCIANAQGYFEKVNKVCETTLGYSKDELMEKPFKDFIHPDDHHTTDDQMQRLQKNESIHSYVNRFTTKTGSHVWLEWNITPFQDKYFATARNITEDRENALRSKIQQERLEQLSRRFAFATRSANIGVWEWNVISNKLSWDDKMFELYHTTPQLFNGDFDAWKMMIHSADRAGVEDDLQKTLVGEKDLDRSFRIIPSDGVTRHIRAYGTAERDSDGVPLRMVGVNWDITRDKENEQKLKHFEAVVRDSSDGVITTDLQGTVTAWNEGARNILGYGADEMIGRDIAQTDPDPSVQIRQHLQEVAQGHRIVNMRTTRRHKSRGVINVSITLSPIYSDNNSVIGISMLARDISQEIEVERMKDEFLSTASHELRTPLTAIDGIVDMIVQGEYGQVGEDVRKALKDVGISSDRLLRLVNDLLDYSRMEAGRLSLTLTHFGMRGVVDEVMGLMSVVAQKKGVSLDISHFQDAQVLADISKVKQILTNLIGNAIKFTDAGGITVSSSLGDRVLSVHVTDTGIGIRDEDRHKIFHKFRQVDTNPGRSQGTGLGLYIAQELCRRMGGDLYLDSSKYGKGSVFVFNLPLAHVDRA